MCICAGAEVQMCRCRGAGADGVHRCKDALGAGAMMQVQMCNDAMVKMFRKGTECRCSDVQRRCREGKEKVQRCKGAEVKKLRIQE